MPLISTSSLLLPLLALPLTSLAKPTTVQINTVDHAKCPFNVTGTVAADFESFELLYTTKSSTVSTLAAYGPDIPESENIKKCYSDISFNFEPWRQDLSTSGVELEGSGLRLDEGLEARLVTKSLWDAWASPQDNAVVCQFLTVLFSPTQV